MAVKKKAVARKKKASRALTTNNMAAKLAEMAEQEAAKERAAGAGRGITWPQAGGVFELDGAELGEELELVILDSVYSNNYYDRPYDPDSGPAVPACFALADTEQDMVPHDSAPVPQADRCAECDQNAFGSDVRGRGKACRNTRLLLVVDPALEEDPVHMRAPPTSLRNYSAYVRGLMRQQKRPPFAVVTRFRFDEDSDYAALKFSHASSIEDATALGEIMALREQWAEELRTPPDASGYEPPPAKSARRKTRAKR